MQKYNKITDITNKGERQRVKGEGKKIEKQVSLPIVFSTTTL
jgi:hypothetical protein